MAWADEDILEALHLRDHEGLPYSDIGERFGKTKSAMAGLFKRITDADHEHNRSTVGDGTMKPKWWRR